MSLDYSGSYVNKILLPGGGRKYSGTHSKGLIWLKNEAGQHFPNHLIRKGTKSILLYSHGNGGSLGDFKSITFFYAQWFNTSVFAIEYPSYGPAEGDAGEESVNDNLKTAYNFLLFLGYSSKNIILMGYSIGTGPSIQLASELSIAGSPPGAVITIAAYLSICDIVRDLKGSIKLVSSLLAGIIDNRWDSEKKIQSVTCPCLFVHGELDEVIPSRHSKILYEKCGSSIKKLRTCPKADHTHFEEPVDTVHPIANFLSDFFKPDLSVHVVQIPARFSLCPQSVLFREANMKNKESGSMTELGFQGLGDSCESTCFNLYDMLNWVIGSNQKKVTSSLGDSYTLKDDIVIQDLKTKRNSSSTRGRSKSNSTLPVGPMGSGMGTGTGSGSRTNSMLTYQQQSSLQDETSNGDSIDDKRKEKEKEKERGRGREKEKDLNKDAMSTIRSTCSDGDSISSSDDSKYSIPPTLPLPSMSPRTALSSNAMKILRLYYSAFNDHDIREAVGYLGNNIQVTFPDIKKNWSTSIIAYDRYTIMFRKSPELKGKFSLLDLVHEKEETIITVYCHFTCSISGVNTVREMVYVIKDDLIQMIHNKY